MSKIENKKVRYISARVTHFERDELTKRAAGRSLSDYIRGRIFQTRSRAPLKKAEQKMLDQFAEISESVSEFKQIVATLSTLKRGDIIDFLQKLDADLQAARRSILKDGIDDGDS